MNRLFQTIFAVGCLFALASCNSDDVTNDIDQHKVEVLSAKHLSKLPEAPTMSPLWATLLIPMLRRHGPRLRPKEPRSALLPRPITILSRATQPLLSRLLTKIRPSLPSTKWALFLHLMPPNRLSSTTMSTAFPIPLRDHSPSKQ